MYFSRFDGGEDHEMFTQSAEIVRVRSVQVGMAGTNDDDFRLGSPVNLTHKSAASSSTSLFFGGYRAQISTNTRVEKQEEK